MTDNAPGNKLVILFIAANPANTPKLNLDREIKFINEALQKAQYRDRFDLRSAWAVDYNDLPELLLHYSPHIVHFSGHGSTAGEIVLEDKRGGVKPVAASSLAELFKILRDNVRCVVLNACYSEIQARAIAENIDYVVGMSRAIADDLAIEFAAGFYLGLGYGRTLQTAFDLGCNRIGLANGGNVIRDLSLLAVKTDAGERLITSPASAIPQLIALRHDPAQDRLTGMASSPTMPPASKPPASKPETPSSAPRARMAMTAMAGIILILVALLGFVIWQQRQAQNIAAHTPTALAAISSPETAIPAPVSAQAGTTPVATATPPPANTPPTNVATAQSSPIAAAPPTATAPVTQMAIITTTGAGSPQAIAVKLESLLFQTDPRLYLRSGESLPFTNIQRIDVGKLTRGIVPLQISFADGTTLAGSVIDGSDLLEAETAHGFLQTHLALVQQIQFPAQAAPASPSAPLPLVTITTPDGEMAQVIAATMVIHGNNGLNLHSGEFVPFTDIQRIEVGELQGMVVPLTITYSDGSSANDSIKKDDDLVEGKTLHGDYQSNLYALKQLQFQ